MNVSISLRDIFDAEATFDTNAYSEIHHNISFVVQVGPAWQILEERERSCIPMYHYWSRALHTPCFLTTGSGK